MSASHNVVLGSYSVDRSADGFDVIWNKFNPKWQMDESELHIIRINRKKQQPEIRANQLDFVRPVRTVQIVTNNNNKNNNNKTIMSSVKNESEATSLLGDNVLLLDNNNEVDEEEIDIDYQADDGSESRPTAKRKNKNGQQPIKKYVPISADPKGARVYGRWSKWSKCSGK